MDGSITYDARSPGSYYSGGFSPYHDDDAVLDFFQDDAQRITSIISAVFAVHLALFFVLSPHFIMPDLKPDEPDIVPVQIVTFDPTPEAEPEAAPPPEVIRPAIPAPAVTPRPKPRPVVPAPQRPEPEPEPVFTPPSPLPEPEIIPEPEPLPEPEPIPEPEIEPEITFNPPPEIISQPVIEPDPIAEPEPFIEPEPIEQPIVQEPLPDPIIETPVIEPPMIEPEEIIPAQPIIEIFEPLPEPIAEDPALLEPLLPEPLAPEPLLEEPPFETIVTEEPFIETEAPPAPFTTPEPLELDPLPGAVIEELPPLIEIIPEVLPEPLPEPAPEPPAVETIDPPDVLELEPEPVLPENITTAPTILASPDAPTTPEEAEIAVPQSQSDPMRDLLRQPTGLPPANTGAGGPTISGPLTGGGNEAIPGGGTRRAAPGAGGWTLAPSGRKSPGAGYDGIILDIRCREAGRTHENCPEYLTKYQGRNAAGWESFEGMAGTGTDRGEATRGMQNNKATGGVVGGGQNIWVVPLGDNSFNNGGPSTTILDDGPEVSFDREFLNKPVIVQEDENRLRDLFKEPEDTTTLPNWMLPETLPEKDPEN